MMKIFFKSCMITLLIILCFSCRKNVNVENNQKISAINVENNQEVPIVNIEYPIEKWYDSNVICYTNITDNNVNVRLLPSLEGKIIYKLQNDDIVIVRGFSNETMTIDNFNGNWVCISYKYRELSDIKYNESVYIDGWVFSKYVNIGDKKPAPIKFVEMMSNNEKPKMIKLSFNLEEEEIFKEVEFTDIGKYYLITWGPGEFGYHYRNIPGVYFLSKDTFELKHFTYSGAFTYDPVGWTNFTDDFEYVIQDAGTSSGIRGIKAWRCSTNETVYQGIYYGYSGIKGHTIDVVYVCDDGYYNLGRTDNEIMQYGKRFIAENPELPEKIEKGREQGLYVEVIVRCKINLDTGERTIIGGEYILMQ